MPLSEHVYCVAIAFKMNEQVEQQICITVCVKLEHSSPETMWMIQKATATGNWWLAASSQQCTHSCITSYAEIFGETSSHPGDSALLQPRFDFWLFPKLKSPLKGKRLQTIHEIQENTTGHLMAIGSPVWGPKVPTVKGTEASLSSVQGFLYLLQSLFFILYGLFWPTISAIFSSIHFIRFTLNF